MTRHAASAGWTASMGCFTLTLLLVLATTVAASSIPTRTLMRRDELGNGVLLKVLPIGDSITYGTGSDQESSYRKLLHESLEKYSNDIDFVGGTSDGNFPDNQHEGHRGYTISQIEAASDVGVYEQPNIVLLHAGTNNMKNDADANRAPDDLRSLIDHIYEHWEDAVILLAQIVPSPASGFAPRIETFNDEVAGIVDEYIGKDKKMVLVDMATPFAQAKAEGQSVWYDNLHPNPAGYQIMATQWLQGILAADDDGLISKPGDGEKPPSSTENCYETPSWYRRNQIAVGARKATSDGPLVPDWGVRRLVMEDGNCEREAVRFLDLDGDGLKDYACLDLGNSSLRVWRNIQGDDYKSTGEWEELGVVAEGDADRDGTRILFADLNGDGRDDYIWINSRTEKVEAWINEGQNTDTGNWQWNWVGVISEGVENLSIDTLRMGDIDGDGRDDFIIVDEKTGAATAWLNTGADDMPAYYKLGEIGSGETATESDKVVFTDLTGNGRADYVLVGESGKAVGIVNRMQGQTLLPRWMQAVTLREWPEAEGEGKHKQEAIHIVDITGNGRADYLVVSAKGSVAQYENISEGGKWQEGEGVFLCDLDGDGVKDYFWIDPTGKGWGHLNKGRGTDKWENLGNIAKGNHDREEIRMAVLTASGRADYVVVNKHSGKARWYENLGPDGDGNYQFAQRGYIAEGPENTIRNTFKMHWNAKNVRFADLDGDGLEDYVYVDDKGAVVWWRFRGADQTPILAAPVLVADGVGVQAKNVHFADTDGDQKLDYVVVGQITGAATVYRNLGFRGSEATDGTPGSIRWDKPASFADGVAGDNGGKTPGRSVRLAEMTGDHRWDYVVVGPDQGAVLLWQNRCWPRDDDSDDSGGGGDDDDDDEPKCKWGPTDSQGWDGSGAGKWLDDFLSPKPGTEIDNWLTLMDKKYNNGNNTSILKDCGHIGDDCDAINAACSSVDPPEYWWVRVLADSTHSIFREAKDRLTEETISDITTVGTMVKDFDAEDPDTDTLNTVFSAFSAISGVAGAVATAGGAAGAANIFGLVGGAISLVQLGLDSQGELEGPDEIETKLMRYVGAVFVEAREKIEDALASIFHIDGSSNDDIQELYDQLTKNDLVKEGDRKSIQAKLFDGGGFLNQGEQSIKEVIIKSYESLGASVLGHLLASMKYIVVDSLIYDRDPCDYFESARMIDDTCLYFVRRPRNADTSEMVPADVTQLLEQQYNIPLEDILRSSRDCNNGKSNETTGIYTDGNYPKCFFGMGFVQANDQQYPFLRPKNQDKLPSWAQDNYDKFREPFAAGCKLDSWALRPECHDGGSGTEPP